MTEDNNENPTLVALYKLVLLMCGGVVFLALLFICFVYVWSGNEQPNAESTFNAITAWDLPADCKIDEYRFTYSDWPGDGDALVVANVGQATLKDLMSLSGFVWKDWRPDDGVLLQVHGLPTFDATHFRAEHVLPNDDWHRGKIIMVNTNTGDVCGYSWKY